MKEKEKRKEKKEKTISGFFDPKRKEKREPVRAVLLRSSVGKGGRREKKRKGRNRVPIFRVTKERWTSSPDPKEEKRALHRKRWGVYIYPALNTSVIFPLIYEGEGGGRKEPTVFRKREGMNLVPELLS